MLDVGVSAAGDQVLIAPSGSTIDVSGTNYSLQSFANVTSLVVQGANTLSQDVPNQGITFGGSGGTITLDAESGADALNVSGVTSVSITDVTITAISGDVTVNASETTSATGTLAINAAPQVSVAVTGATIHADNVTLDAAASSTSTYSAPLGGVLNAAGVAAATADLEPSATVTILGPSTNIAANGPGGNIAIEANVSAIVNTTVTVGTDAEGNALNPVDAAIAESTVNSKAITQVGGGSTISAGTGTLSVTSTNTTTVTTQVDGSSRPRRRHGAVTLDDSTSQAFVNGGASLSGGTVNVLATTTNSANTTAKASATGGGTNPEIASILGGGANKTSPAMTAASDGVPLTVSGAVAVTRFTPTTQAYVDSSTVRAGDAINIAASSDNNTTTNAKAPAPSLNQTFGATNIDPTGYLISLPDNGYVTGQPVFYHAVGGSVGGLTDGHPYFVIVDPTDPDEISLAASYADATASTPVPIQLSAVTGTMNTLSPPPLSSYVNPTTQASENGVGVAVAIDDTVLSNTAMVEATGGVTSLSAPTIVVQATTPSVSPSDVHNASASATSGVSASNVGVAGALALNIVSNTTEAKVPLGSTVSTTGDVTFNAQDSAAETASAKASDSKGNGAGVGASVALNIAGNTTLADLESDPDDPPGMPGAQLTGAHNLTFTAASTDVVSTSATAGSSGGTVSVTPSAGITVVTNTTAAQVGTPDAANDPLTVGGAFSATATHTGLASTATAAVSGAGSTASVGATLALAFVTDQTTATTGRSINAMGGGVTFEADGSAASLVSANASASGGGESKSSEQSRQAGSTPADGSKAAAGSDTADPNSVDGQNAQQRAFADSESKTVTDAKGKPVPDSGTTKTPAAQTSDGSITVAAAVALNIVNSAADATIPAGLSITAAGPLIVTAINDTGYIDNDPNLTNPIFLPLQGMAGDSANAWGTAGGTSTVGIGAAIALNLVNNSTEATIGAATINAHGVTVNAGMMNPDPTNTPVNAFTATAASGAAGGDVGVAGSVAINIVANTSQALIETGAAVAANGSDVTVTALNNANDQALAFPASSGGSGTATSVGIGASLGLNIVTNTTQAEIEDGAAETNAGNVTVTSSSSLSVNTWGQNGASGNVGIGAGIAIAIVGDQTTARIGSDPLTLDASGGVTIGTSGSFASNSLADAVTAGGSTVGLGASVVVNVSQIGYLAELDRNVIAGGAVSVTDTAITSSQATATASEKGADPGASSSSTGSDAPADTQSQNQSSFAHAEGGAMAPDVAAPPKANDELSSPSSKAGSKSGGSSGQAKVGVAAAVAVNVLTTSTVAEIDNGLTVTAAGALTVGTTNQAAALALADGRATSNKDSIGAAVSLNVVNETNTASIGTGDTVSAAGVSVTALMNSGQVNDFSSQGLGVAIGQQAGIAGSVGINVITIDTQASIGAGAVVKSSGGLSVQAANDETFQNITFTLADGSDLGAGAAVNVNVLNNSTLAFLDSTVQADVADATQITSESSVNPSQDPIPNSLAEAIITTGNLTQGSPIITSIGGSINNSLGRKENNPIIGEPVIVGGTEINPMLGEPVIVSGSGVSAFPTSIAIYKSLDFSANLTLGSDVIISSDPQFKNPLMRPIVGDTINGPGIPYSGPTVVAVSYSGATGLVITLSQPVIGAGATTLSWGRMVLADPAPASGQGVDILFIPVDLLTQAISGINPTNFAAGAGVSSDGAGVAASVVVNVVGQTTQAFIGSGDLINTNVGTTGFPTADADEGVTVSATQTTNFEDGAGAVGKGKNAGLGAAVEVNIINQDDEAYIAPSSIVDALQNVVVEASTSGSYDIAAVAGALTVAKNGNAVSAGITAAVNDITTNVAAYVNDATVKARLGSVTINASAGGTINTIAVPIAVSVAGDGTGNSAAVSGGGAISLNSVVTNVNAFGQDSSITAGGGVTLKAEDSSQITATVITVAVSATDGQSAGSASLGAAISRNFVGYNLDGTAAPAEVRAYLTNTSVSAGGVLSLDADTSGMQINSIVVAGAVAVAVGEDNAFGLAGSGVDADNRIALDVEAYLANVPTPVSAASVSITASDTSAISSAAGAASLAGSFGETGVAVAIGLSLATNEINNVVDAYVTGAPPAE